MPESKLATGEIKFHFKKSKFFRVIHVDGAFGSFVPQGSGVQMAVYSERAPLPREVVHTINNGVLGPDDLEKRVVKDGIFREVETSLVMSFETAAAVRDWLSARLDEVKSIRSSIVPILDSVQNNKS